ncbi:hypothetical protein [Curtobacterium sp. MCBD17_021]|uniref:hypothetical protein n=1 Tax=Curtobacterium sp. MCBD17_021 TaxID=2175665 RepID=UPI0011B4231F|nr:hypothetical protein [Curtobacterium sp. MCBD17_021]
MTQTPSTRTLYAPAAPLTGVRTAVELLLGLSFLVTVSSAGYGAATGQMSVVAQVGAVVFLVTLTCALVSWFRTADGEPSDC